eukprot:CAMPEP_0196736678 /NCGR_PEP_ID=MMETSP1091-20130531/14659_1 /TAXON_ID=302021 /ORGANISM="Rhodomonas sp., Strain CCMP768" /LENGTH=107 /DNA_ID=CAMNT_0042080449 /DNA_START=326 /DNA_END=646 /DNA_ORIENTATION=+
MCCPDPRTLALDQNYAASNTSDPGTPVSPQNNISQTAFLFQEGSARQLVDALQAVFEERELLDAVVNPAFVLVDVGPSVAGRTHGGHVTRRRLRDSVKASEHRSLHT